MAQCWPSGRPCSPWPSSAPACTHACCAQLQSEAPMPNLPESFLALVAGPDRAAAIIGDLTEMAASRGRLWFFAAYPRTLGSFTWRIVLALFVAAIGRQTISYLFYPYIRPTPAAWRNATGSWLDLLNSSGPLLACIMSTLWFVLPFAVIRYGRRDRFVQLTFAVAVGTTLAFLSIPDRKSVV